MDSMAQFVEQGNNFVVFQKTGRFRTRSGEAAHQRCGGVSAFAVFLDEALREVSSDL